jgi:hypothetical protein
MNLNALFQNDPPFITVNSDGFQLDGTRHPSLHVYIEDYIAVRKLFEGRSLSCQSIGAVKNRQGRHCSLCSMRYRCRQGIRLMLLLDGESGQRPAALDVGSASFPSLQALLDRISPEQLAETLVEILVRPESHPIQLTFEDKF